MPFKQTQHKIIEYDTTYRLYPIMPYGITSKPMQITSLNLSKYPYKTELNEMPSY